MIYVYECTHPDCGAVTERIRTVAQADDPVACPCSGSHETRRVLFPGGVLGVLRSGSTRGGQKPGWEADLARQYRQTQIKRTMEETF